MAKASEWLLDRKTAEFYEQQFVPAIFDEWARLLVDAVDLKPGQRVLDVGCGTGIVARVVTDRVGDYACKVTGIDLNAGMLEVARLLRPGIEWREAEASDLPFPAEAFDIVLCQAALMFFPDQVAALREMHRVTRAGGIIAVQVFGESPGYDLAADVLERVASKEAADIFRSPSLLKNVEHLNSLFQLAGLTHVEIKSHQGMARFPSLESFVRAEIDGWVLAGRVDTDAFLEALRDEMQEFRDARGEVRIPIEGHIVMAHKAETA